MHRIPIGRSENIRKFEKFQHRNIIHMVTIKDLLLVLFLLASITIGLVIIINNPIQINEKSSNNAVMYGTEWEESRNNLQDVIMVNTSFKPTLDLSDYIRNTSLDSIIIKTLSSKYSAQTGYEVLDIPVLNGKELMYSSEAILETRLKGVPATSNLAKVYYLEKKSEFIEHNKQYYDRVVNAYHKSQKKQFDNTDSWEEYLK